MGILRNKEQRYEPIRIEDFDDEAVVNEYGKYVFLLQLIFTIFSVIFSSRIFPIPSQKRPRIRPTMSLCHPWKFIAGRSQDVFVAITDQLRLLMDCRLSAIWEHRNGVECRTVCYVHYFIKCYF